MNGAIHDIDHPAVTEGGLAVLRGNLAPDGCVVKTAGVPKEIWTFRGPALVVESQEQAIEVILNDTLKPGMALVIRYEGARRAALACRRCCTRRRSSRARVSANRSPCSPTVATPAVPPVWPSATWRRGCQQGTGGAHQERRHHRYRYPEPYGECRADR